MVVMETRSLFKSKGVVGAEKEVPVHMRIKSFLVTLRWEALVADGAFLPKAWRGQVQGRCAHSGWL